MEDTRQPTYWDEKYSDEYLEQWLYGKQSLTGATRRWLIARVAELAKGISFLDLGCGGGVTAFHLQQAGLLDHVDYTGVDFTRKMIQLAQRKIPRAKFIHSSIQDYSRFSEQAYDAILLRAVLEHIEDPYPVVDAAAKLLRAGGLFFLIFWNNPVQDEPIVARDPNGFFDNAHSAEALKLRFLANGLTIVEQHAIVEPSARGDHRDIWVMRRDER